MRRFSSASAMDLSRSANGPTGCAPWPRTIATATHEQTSARRNDRGTTAILPLLSPQPLAGSRHLAGVPRGRRLICEQLKKRPSLISPSVARERQPECQQLLVFRGIDGHRSAPVLQRLVPVTFVRGEHAKRAVRARRV